MIVRSRSVGLMALTTSVVLSAVGQLGMKVGMQRMHVLAADAVQMTWPPLEPVAFWIVVGIASYVLSLAAWLVVLIRYPLSYAYPFLGLSYVLVYVGATQWGELAEPVTPLRTIGTICVIAGVALVSARAKHDSF
jgi:undecaprenyl phosphate-alpha-L-ara4N flippase subunit ArnF